MTENAKLSWKITVYCDILCNGTSGEGEGGGRQTGDICQSVMLSRRTKIVDGLCQKYFSYSGRKMFIL